MHHFASFWKTKFQTPPPLPLSVSRGLACMHVAEIARQNTQNELVAAQEKSDFSFNL